MKEENKAKMVNRSLQTLARERRKILSRDPANAVNHILDTPQPAALVHSFPAQDFHLLIRDIGLSDALPLLALASNRQWEHIFDMEVWQRDRMDLPGTTSWLALLLKADAARLVKWSATEKTEFIKNYLFHNIDVTIREHDQDPGDFGEGFFTLDNVFYVRIKPLPPGDADGEASHRQSEKIRQEVISEYLNRLAVEDHLRYQTLLFESAHVLPAEAEETAYRWRNVRMAEKGFLPFEEAVGVYQPLAPGDLEAPTPRVSDLKAETAAAGQTPLYPARVMDAGDPFFQFLETLDDDDLRERVQGEFAALANRIAVADQTAIRSKEELAQVVRKTCGYLNIGLERLSTKSSGSDRATEFLTRHPLAEIFRVGYGGALKLKWATEEWLKLSWFTGQGLALGFWGESGLGVLGGLMLKKPLFYDSASSGESYREFSSLVEIQQTDKALNAIIALDELLARLPVNVQARPADRLLTWENLLLTLWSRHYQGRETTPQPLSLADFTNFWRDLWVPGPSPRRIADPMKAHFLDWLAGQTQTSVEKLRADFAVTFEELFSRLEAQYGSVSEKDLDPRYVLHFWLKN